MRSRVPPSSKVASEADAKRMRAQTALTWRGEGNHATLSHRPRQGGTGEGARACPRKRRGAPGLLYTGRGLANPSQAAMPRRPCKNRGFGVNSPTLTSVRIHSRRRQVVGAEPRCTRRHTDEHGRTRTDTDPPSRRWRFGVTSRRDKGAHAGDWRKTGVKTDRNGGSGGNGGGNE